MRERTWDRNLKNRIEKAGGWSIKLSTDFITGLPDRLILLPGGYVAFAEIKTTGQKPRKIQLFIHKKLKKLGFKVYVVDSQEDINLIIDEYERS